MGLKSTYFLWHFLEPVSPLNPHLKYRNQIMFFPLSQVQTEPCTAVSSFVEKTVCGCESLNLGPLSLGLPPLMLLTLIPKIKQCMAYQARIYRYVCTDICINQCWHMVVIHKFNETTVCLRIGRWVMAGGQQLRYKYVAAEKKAGGRIFGLFLLGPPPTRSTTTRLNWKLTSVVIWQQGASYFGQNAR